MTVNTIVGRWSSTIAGSIALVGIGLLTGHAAFFVAATFPLAFTLYATITAVPDLEAIEIERDFTPQTPYPGKPVTVTVSITNTDTTPVADLRLVDGVPDECIVTDGSPRAAVALRPESSTSYEYVIRAPRGRYEFTDATVRLRSLSADSFSTQPVTSGGDTLLDCTLPVAEAPLETDTTPYIGTLTADSPGDGLEFHSTREYRYGDSIRRVNWRQYAKTGALTTIEYNEPRTATILLLVDAREVGDVAPFPSAPTGTELVGYAAEQLLSAFRGENHTVGVAITGLDSGSVEQIGFVQPTTDSAVLTDVETMFEALAEGDDVSSDLLKRLPSADSLTESTKQLCGHLSSDTQVVYLTPAIDDAAAEPATVLNTYGHQVTCLSPDIVTTGTYGQAIADIERGLRLADLTDDGIEVIDWPHDTPLEFVLATHNGPTKAPPIAEQ